MKLPNKIYSYKESTIAKFPRILCIVSESDINPKRLYQRCKGGFQDINDFMDTLDCLFALGVIEFDEEYGVIHYVERNI